MDIDDANERILKAKGKLKSLESKHDVVKKNLVQLASVITGSEQNMDTSGKLMNTCQNGLDALLQRLLGLDLEKLQDDMEEINFKPTGPEFEDDFK